jgi:hypothetical protein
MLPPEGSAVPVLEARDASTLDEVALPVEELL